MQIFVTTVSGDTITLTPVLDTVSGVKEQLLDTEGIPVEMQRLIYGGKEMTDEKSLSFYNVEEFSTLHLVIGLPGGLFHPEDRKLAQKYLCNKMICRKCYARLPPRAKRCRKAKCGRTTNIRPKKWW